MTTLPSSSVVFKLVLTVNLASAIWNIILDCDETYNYWEPLHFLLYGSGFQTWEYSPAFALRSYTYLWLYGILGKFLTILHLPKLFVFYAIRIQCSVIMSLCQLYLYTCLKRRMSDPVHTLFTMMFSVLSCGNFISSTAFLPSSFAMYCSYIYLGAWLDRKYKIAVLAVALSAIVGWPFSAALGIPLVIDMIFVRRKLLTFLYISIGAGILITLPMIVVDSLYFGKLIVAPISILYYNVFSAHGSELYGTEPFLFYIQNYFLNFNIASLIAYSLPSIALGSFVIKRDISALKLTLFATPFFLWNIIFFLQPHKEERFLFPCYPFLCYSSGLAVSLISLLFNKFSSKFNVFRVMKYLFYGVIVMTFVTLSVSRILLLLVSFRAPFLLYTHMSVEVPKTSFVNQTMICVGKEWYRFPNSFFLKPHMDLHFLESNFKGQLPAKYSSVDGLLASRVVHNHFNEMNKEEPSRYVNLNRCDFIVDRVDDTEETVLQPRYSKNRAFTVIFNSKFLDNSKSRGIFKSFYIPFLYNSKNVFVDYQLLMRHDISKV